MVFSMWDISELRKYFYFWSKVFRRKKFSSLETLKTRSFRATLKNPFQYLVITVTEIVGTSFEWTLTKVLMKCFQVRMNSCALRMKTFRVPMKCLQVPMKSELPMKCLQVPMKCLQVSMKTWSHVWKRCSVWAKTTCSSNEVFPTSKEVSSTSNEVINTFNEVFPTSNEVSSTSNEHINTLNEVFQVRMNCLKLRMKWCEKQTNEVPTISVTVIKGG